MQVYDYIITGTGASGLMMAYRMVTDPFFKDKQILLIDKEKKIDNDRTWCYWQQGKGIWNHLVKKQWGHIVFASPEYVEQISITPYTYHMIRSASFYADLQKVIKDASQVTWIEDTVLSIIDNDDVVKVQTEQDQYWSKKVLNSIPLSEAYKKQSKYPVLNQHFIGWFITTRTPFFDDNQATFMDFQIAQKGNTRFMYILPFSDREALVEYTLFSEHLLAKQEYENEIIAYLEKQGVKEYQVTEKEKGCIPMTSYRFDQQNSKNVLYIGTAGGWAKASTGYTFRNTTKKTSQLISFLKTNQNLARFDKKTRFWYYDLMFLDVLYKENDQGSMLFSRLFKKNKITTILRFLDEETTFWEELTIMWSMPIKKFIKVIWKRLF